MEKEKILNIVDNIEDKSNKDLILTEESLFNEYEKTKELILSLTRHLDGIEELHKKVTSEIKKRNIK